MKSFGEKFFYRGNRDLPPNDDVPDPKAKEVLEHISVRLAEDPELEEEDVGMGDDDDNNRSE